MSFLHYPIEMFLFLNILIAVICRPSWNAYLETHLLSSWQICYMLHDLSYLMQNEYYSKSAGTIYHSCVPILIDVINSISTWISNHIPSKVYGEITYPYPNFSSCTAKVWEWINYFIPHCIMDIIKSPQSGVTLCFQFVSAASVSASAAATTFASHVKTIWAKP